MGCWALMPSFYTIDFCVEHIGIFEKKNLIKKVKKQYCFLQILDNYIWIPIVKTVLFYLQDWDSYLLRF